GGIGGSPALHARQISVDDYEGDVVRSRGSASGSGVGVGGGESGRQSVASTSRHSLEDGVRAHREREREEALRMLAGGEQGRSESVLARASPATFQRLRDREVRERERERDREKERERERDRDVYETPSRPPRYSHSGSVTAYANAIMATTNNNSNAQDGNAHNLNNTGTVARRERANTMHVSELGEVGMATFDSQETVLASAGERGNASSGSGSGFGRSGGGGMNGSGAGRSASGFGSARLYDSPTLAVRALSGSSSSTHQHQRVVSSPVLVDGRRMLGVSDGVGRRVGSSPYESTKRLPGTPNEGSRRLPTTPLEGTKRLPTTPLEGTKRLPTTPLEGTKRLPPLDIPKPIAVLPSERRARTSMEGGGGMNSSGGERGSVGDSARGSAGDSASGGERGSSASASTSSVTRRRLTIRGTAPGFPTLTTPSNAAAVLTPHTVSNSP
ncbi:hypothetical protein CVT24_006817, partial [Panaeolus cyanescens]